MQNIYLEILLIIFIFSPKMYCNILCQRCCVEKEYIHIEKVFGNALENGAANGAIDDLNKDILNIQGILEDNENFRNLQQYFTTKKNSLPQQSYDFTNNRKRLNVANDCFIINEVICILKTCYKNYKSFLEQDKEKTFTVESFNNYFTIFLKLCELMIKESLENYRLVEGNDERESIVSQLQQDNPFKGNINVNKNKYKIEDTTELRNKIGYLFNIFFDELIKYRLKKDFDKEATDIKDDIDGLSL